jgi:hypothetical protein
MPTCRKLVLLALVPVLVAAAVLAAVVWRGYEREAALVRKAPMIAPRLTEAQVEEFMGGGPHRIVRVNRTEVGVPMWESHWVSGRVTVYVLFEGEGIVKAASVKRDPSPFDRFRRWLGW